MNTILEFLERLLNWFVESGLAEKGVDSSIVNKQLATLTQ